MMWTRTLLIGALVAGAGVLSLAEDEARGERAASRTETRAGRRAWRAIESAVARFGKLVEEEKYAAARELAEKTCTDHPRSATARLMLRQIGIIELIGDTTSETFPDGAEAEPAAMQLRTYPVADLVVPIPNTMTIGIGRPTDGAIGIGREDERTEIDFDSLIEIVTSSVFPDSWSAKGGEGSVEPHETTLSLVIRQTPEAHEEIADLLKQLRRLQDIQVTLELRYVAVPSTYFERIGVDFDRDEPRYENWNKFVSGRRLNSFVPELDEDGHVVLGEGATKALIRSMQSETRTNIMFAPKITLFNGQSARILNDDVDNGTGLLVQAVISADRRHVRVRLARDSADALDVLSSVKTYTPADGHTIVIDRGTTRTIRQVSSGVPFVSKVPYVNRLFKNTAAAVDEQRLLLMVTPRVVIQEEEEELLGVEPPKAE